MKKNIPLYIVYTLGIVLAAVLAINLVPFSSFRVSTSDSVPVTAAAYARPDINTATSRELESVEGIGPVTAAAIIKYREKHGPFENMDALVKVSALTQARLNKLRSKFKAGNI